MFGLLSRATASLKNPSSPYDWTPDTPLPSGFFSHSFASAYPLTPKFHFRAAGSVAKGSIVLDVAPPGETAASGAGRRKLPEYDAAMRDKGPEWEEWSADGEEVQLVAEVRANDKASVREEDSTLLGEEEGVVLQTPSQKSLGTSVSYYVTITFPHSASSNTLRAIIINLQRFRITLTAAFCQQATLTLLSLTTVDAPITISGSLTNIQDLAIRNGNQVVGDSVAVKTFEPLVRAEGDIVVKGTLTILVTYGAIVIDGNTGAGSTLKIQTTNSSVTLQDVTGKTVQLETSNGSVAARKIVALDGPLTVSNQYGSVKAELFRGREVKIESSYEAITGRIEATDKVSAQTTFHPIQMDIGFLVPPSSSDPSVNRSPSLLNGSAPPSFAEALRTTPRVLDVHVETTDARIDVKYDDMPKEVVLRSKVVGSRGTKVEVVHGAGFAGSFYAITSLAYNAALDYDDSKDRRVSFSTKKRNEVAGHVNEGGENADGLQSSSEAINSNGAVAIVLQ